MTFTARCSKNNPLNCWEPLKTHSLQRRHETVKRERGESRKKNAYGVWLNPKRCHNGQSAAKARTEQGSTTIPQGSTRQATRKWRASQADEDIVWTALKDAEAYWPVGSSDSHQSFSDYFKGGDQHEAFASYQALGGLVD